MIIKILNIVVAGLLKGGIYAIIAMGLSLQYGVARVFNIAHGEFILLGAFSSFILFVIFHVNPLISLVICSPVFFLIGFFLHKTIFKKLANSSKSPAKFESKSLLATFSLFFIIQYITPSVWFGTQLEFLRLIDLGGVVISTDLLLTLIFALIIALVFYLFLAHTRLGKAIRASSQDSTLARLMGVDVNHILALCFGLGTLMAAFSGILIGISSKAFMKPMGMEYTFVAVIIVTLGGFGSIAGSIIGGLILGVVGSIVTYIRPDLFTITYYTIFILLLLIRPKGLMGK
jgi:branched-chain amino acid transport system permease protein